MSDDRSLPFKDRAYQNYKDEMERLKSVEEKLRAKGTPEIEKQRDPLSYEERKEIVILLSWGGPSDGYKIYCGNSGDVLEGFYFFADWFEYEEIKLSDTELERVVSVYPFEHLF